MTNTQSYEQLNHNQAIKKYKNWTNEDVSNLILHYPESSWSKLLSVFPLRNKDDITQKAHSIGLKRNQNSKWSNKELDILMENYRTLSTNELINLMPNRTSYSIITKAKRMGLINREKWTKEEKEKLIRLYPISSNEELAKEFQNRTTNAILEYAQNKLYLKKSEKYFTNKKDDLRIELIQSLKELAEALGRTPYMDEVNNGSNTAGISTYIRCFGSYSSACVASGLEPNNNLFGKTNVYYSISNDICLSKYELDITNYFIENNISYKKEVLYREIMADERCGSRRVDWLVNENIIVEYFGMMDKESYAERTKFKIDLCRDNNIKLIEVYPHDFINNMFGLIEKLKQII